MRRIPAIDSCLVVSVATFENCIPEPIYVIEDPMMRANEKRA